MPDITYDVGRVSFIMKGAWNLATNYEKLDAVTHDGSLYIAKQDVPGGTAITNTTYWVLAVEKGDQGETGNGIASIAKTGTAGNVDTYTITYTDGTTTTFTVTNGGVTTVNGRTGDVTGLVEEDGSYPLLNAGTADNLTPYSEDSGATQDIPFIAQGTGCGNGESVVDTGSYLQFKKKLGNTVGVNQLVQNGDFSSSSGWGSWYYGGTVSVANNTGTVTGSGNIDISHALVATIPAGHTVLFFATVKGSASGNGSFINVSGQFPITTSFAFVAKIGVLSGSITRAYIARQGSGSFTMDVKNVAVIDLTLWFGSNDRIPSDLLSHPENWGRYYAGSLDYNAGTLESADGTVMRSIGRNFWDEEWELGTINTTTGAKETATNRIRSKNYIPVSPNTECYVYGVDVGAATGRACFYDANKNFVGGMSDFPVSAGNKKFATPSNAHFMLFSPPTSYGTTYGQNIALSRFYTGESGYDQYYPYSVLAEVDTGSEVLRSAGAIADEKTPDGTITRRVGTVDLGSFAESSYNPYEYSGGIDGCVISAMASEVQRPSSASVVGNIQAAGFVNVSDNTFNNDGKDKEICLNNLGYIKVKYDGLTTAAAIKAALSGVYLYYELATPTTEQGTAFPENIPCDDFGSLMWTQTKGIPQGNEIFYPVDYKASIDTLYNRVGGDMSKIVTDDEYPEAPSSDGTYVLKATVSGGTKTYAWVAE